MKMKILKINEIFLFNQKYIQNIIRDILLDDYRIR